ncbi:hypothetical protein H4R34_001992 [Dimargaris verticillata]|uniref:Uncharacterized protein n=1 Tax=Dimargaris verticillata TaxID=2761393 RepID=A0A9W8B3L1_9FUNG|nr:hypothetical protein H4R34_001992 [Dimargaris verticillata]
MIGLNWNCFAAPNPPRWRQNHNYTPAAVPAAPATESKPSVNSTFISVPTPYSLASASADGRVPPPVYQEICRIRQALLDADATHLRAAYTKLKRLGALHHLSYTFIYHIFDFLHQRPRLRAGKLMQTILADFHDHALVHVPAVSPQAWPIVPPFTSDQLIPLYNYLLAFLLRHHRFHTFCEVWRQILIHRLSPDQHTYHLLLTMLQQNGHPDLVRNIFTQLGAYDPCSLGEWDDNAVAHLLTVDCQTPAGVHAVLHFIASQPATSSPTTAMLAVTLATCYQYNQLASIPDCVSMYIPHHLPSSSCYHRFNEHLMAALCQHVESHYARPHEQAAYFDALMDTLQLSLPPSLRPTAATRQLWKFYRYELSDPACDPTIPNRTALHWGGKIPSQAPQQSDTPAANLRDLYTEMRQQQVVPSQAFLRQLVPYAFAVADGALFKSMIKTVRSFGVGFDPWLTYHLLQVGRIKRAVVFIDQLVRQLVCQSLGCLSLVQLASLPLAPYPPHSFVYPVSAKNESKSHPGFTPHQFNDLVLDRVPFSLQHAMPAYHPLVTNARLEYLLSTAKVEQACQYLERLVLATVIWQFEARNRSTGTSLARTPHPHPPPLSEHLPYNAESFLILIKYFAIKRQLQLALRYLDCMLCPPEYFLSRLHHPNQDETALPRSRSNSLYSSPWHVLHLDTSHPQYGRTLTALLWNRLEGRPPLLPGFALDFNGQAPYQPHLRPTPGIVETLYELAVGTNRPRLAYRILKFHRHLCQHAPGFWSIGESMPLPTPAPLDVPHKAAEHLQWAALYKTSPWFAEFVPYPSSLSSALEPTPTTHPGPLTTKYATKLLHLAYRFSHTPLLLTLRDLVHRSHYSSRCSDLYRLLLYYLGQRGHIQPMVHTLRFLMDQGYTPDQNTLVSMFGAVFRPTLQHLKQRRAIHSALDHSTHPSWAKSLARVTALLQFLEHLPPLPSPALTLPTSRHLKARCVSPFPSPTASSGSEQSSAESTQYSPRYPVSLTDLEQLLDQFMAKLPAPDDVGPRTLLVSLLGMMGIHARLLAIVEPLFAEMDAASQPDGPADGGSPASDSHHPMPSKTKACSDRNELRLAGQPKPLPPSLSPATGTAQDSVLDIAFYNAVLDALALTGDVAGVESVYRMFRRQHFKPDVVTYTTLIKAYYHGHCPDRAVQFWWYVWAMPHSDTVTLTILRQQLEVRRQALPLTDEPDLVTRVTQTLNSEYARQASFVLYNARSLTWMVRILELLAQQHMHHVGWVIQQLCQGQISAVVEDRIHCGEPGPASDATPTSSLQADDEVTATTPSSIPSPLTRSWDTLTVLNALHDTFHSLAVHDMLLRARPRPRFFHPEYPKVGHYDFTQRVGFPLFYAWMQCLVMLGDFNGCEEVVDVHLAAAKLRAKASIYDVVLERLVQLVQCEWQWMRYGADLRLHSLDHITRDIYHQFNHYHHAHASRSDYLAEGLSPSVMLGRDEWYVPWSHLRQDEEAHGVTTSGEGNSAAPPPLLPYQEQVVLRHLTQAWAVPENPKAPTSSQVPTSPALVAMLNQLHIPVVPLYYVRLWHHWHHKSRHGPPPAAHGD